MTLEKSMTLNALYMLPTDMIIKYRNVDSPHHLTQHGIGTTLIWCLQNEKLRFKKHL